MGITKNLGGDRLGSGAKMNVEMHGYERATFNMDKITRTTMSVGTLVPIYKQFVQKGDTWELDLNAMVLTHPTEGPLFGKFKLQIDVFTAGLRLYQGKLHMNMLEQGLNMEEIKLPQLKMRADNIDWTKEPNNQQINPSSKYAYLGIRGLGSDSGTTGGEVERYFNAVPDLMYVDIYGNYYANQQEKVGYVIHNTEATKTITSVLAGKNGDPGVVIPFIGGAKAGFDVLPGDANVQMLFNYAGAQPIADEIEIWINGTLPDPPRILYKLTDIFADISYTAGYMLAQTPIIERPFAIDNWQYETADDTDRMPQLFEFPLTNINEMRMDILSNVKSATAYIIDENSIAPYGLGLRKEGTVWSKTVSQEGLLLKTYQSDIFNNWLDTEDINSINTRSKIFIDETEGFTIESFLLNEKLYQYLNRIVMAGNTVDDWEEATYGLKNRHRPEKPIYEGGLSKEVVFDEVVSNSATADQPLGTIAGRGTLGRKHKGGRVSIKAEEHGYLMVIASLTPYLDYYQGNQWDNNLTTYEDIHKPAFDNIGFQNLITDGMASWSTQTDTLGTTQYKSIGKQPSWIHYQTCVNEVYGNFAIKSSEGWMVLTRDYEPDTLNKDIQDATTYIDPAKWNDVFAYKARDAQNFWAQFYIGATARRIMSANQIPNI